MRRLFHRLLSDADRRAIESDLAELYEFHRRHDGERAAARWLRRQQVLYPLHLIWERVRTSLVPDAGVGGLMSGLLNDVKHSAKSLMRSPGLAATIVLTVGLGLGATAAMVTMIHAVVVRPLPYPDQDALVWLYWNRAASQNPLSVADYRAIDEQQAVFSHLAGYETSSVTVSVGESPARVRARSVTWDYFTTLGLAPSRGRLFDKSDDEPDRRVMVLSHEFWATQCGADPAVIGRVIPIDGVAHTVVGVVTAEAGPVDRGIAVFRPVHWNPPPRRGPFFIRAIGRLRPGVSPAAALQQLQSIYSRTFAKGKSSPANPGFAFRDLKTIAVGDVASTVCVFASSAVVNS